MPGERLTRKSATQFLTELLGGKCVRCGSAVLPGLHRKVPLSKGGNDSASNLQLLCDTCFLAENHKTIRRKRRVTSVSYTAEFVPYFDKLRQILRARRIDYSEWVQDQTVRYVNEQLRF